jgi:hypothetical protein
MKEKRLTFDNIREMLLDLLRNAKDENGYDFDIRHTHDKEDYEQIFFKNGYSSAIDIGEGPDENITLIQLTGPVNWYTELFEADIYSSRGEYIIILFIQLTDEIILNIRLTSSRKKDVMHLGRPFDKKTLSIFYVGMLKIIHPKIRELVDLLYEKILVPELTENGGNRNGREKSFGFEGRDEELRSSLYN